MKDQLAKIVAASKVDPRPYQGRVVLKTVGFLNNGIRSVMVNSPTGSGKTIMGLLVAKMLQEQHNIGIGWVAMRRNLLSQTAAENITKEIGVDGIKFISVSYTHLTLPTTPYV